MGLLYAKRIESEIEQDDNKALEWFQKVSEQGSVEGNLCLGYMYSREMSSTYDPEKAFTYYTKAEAQGSGVATRNLAIMHLVNILENHLNQTISMQKSTLDYYYLKEKVWRKMKPKV